VDYAALKLLHQGSVVLSVAGFFARGLGALSGADWVRARAARTLPHLVDTVLLGSALAMLWLLQLAPWDAPWLSAKIVGLLLYIGLGMLALRPGRPLALRAVAWVAALAVVGWMVVVAVTKDPWVGLGPAA
jgi:uncharacterized membrane protein SirB2